MSFSSRLFSLLELELSKQLSFSVSAKSSRGQGNLRPGHVRLRDELELEVTVRNDASFPFRSLRGCISATRFARFRPFNFCVPELAPGESYRLGTLQILVQELPDPRRGRVVDQLTLVSVSATADLSSLAFQEWERPMPFAQGAIPSSNRPGTDGREAIRAQGTSACIGLSPLLEK